MRLSESVCTHVWHIFKILHLGMTNALTADTFQMSNKLGEQTYQLSPCSDSFKKNGVNYNILH